MLAVKVLSLKHGEKKFLSKELGRYARDNLPDCVIEAMSTCYDQKRDEVVVTLIYRKL